MPVGRSAAYAVAAASGFALYAAHPPLDWWWASFLTAPLLVLAIWIDAGRESPPQGARLGAVAGVVAFGPMISWIVAPAGFVGWGLLVATQVAWWAVLGHVTSRFRSHPALPFIVAVAWVGVDAWRGAIPLSGFAWGSIAYAHAEGSWLLPVARVLGARGITLLTVAIGVALLVVGRAGWSVVRTEGVAGLGGGLAPVRGASVVLVASLLVSALAVTDPPATDGTLRVLVAQGNDIRHWERPVADPVTTIARNLHADTRAALAQDPSPDVVVWPESALDRDPGRVGNAELADLVAGVVADGPELLAGTTLDGPDPTATRYVAMSHFVDDAVAVERYVKRRLVPFGEYVPARRWLEWFPPLAQVPRDALAGQGPQQFVLNGGVRVATAICFETLFGGLVRDNVRGDGAAAHVLVAATNDASFRDSAEPEQHLAQSRLRAVETGRWVVHASLAGSSAFIDPDGRVYDRTPVFARATIQRDVPLATGATPFLRVGDVVGWIGRLALLGFLLASIIRPRSGAFRRGEATR